MPSNSDPRKGGPQPLDYVLALRMTVTGGLVAAAIILGALSYLTLVSYEQDSAVNRFNSIADHAINTIQHDFKEKQNAVLAMTKSMAYLKPNISEWPNVVMPGFYDAGWDQRDAASLSDLFFAPIVPPEKLASYEEFLRNYYAIEPAITALGGVPFLDRLGVFARDLLGRPYHDITGEALAYSSPNRIIAPLAQFLFSKYVGLSALAFSTHSAEGFGRSMDAIIACSDRSNYTAAENKCASITSFVYLPLYSQGADVKQVHSAVIQPIYLNQNTSNLVGFMAGGFDWLDLLNTIFHDSPAGIDIIVQNADKSLTFSTCETHVRWRSMIDAHSMKFDDLVRVHRFFANEDGSENDSTYTVSLYPTNTFCEHYSTNVPIYAAVASFVFLLLCAATFFLYDYYMRKAAAANAAVLETKRRFVRFISHEIRTPLNAVHLGLEAFIIELRHTIESAGSTPVDPAKIEEMLLGWLELATEMTCNCDSAEDVLNDLLNYDKIETGTLHLEFSNVPVCDLVQVNTAVFYSQVKQKNIQFSIENRLITECDGDVESQGSSSFVVVGDPARLSQVIRNLISNALQFTPNEGSIAVLVERVDCGLPYPAFEVPAESQDLLQQFRAGSIRISVTDSGAGLSEAQLSQICSEGVQFNANELQAGKGSGLGLFITKGIVEQHGGHLTVTSAGIGAGTTFAVELPLFLLDEHAFLCRQRTGSSIDEVNESSPARVKPLGRVCPSSVVPFVPQTDGDVQRGLQPKFILVVDDAASNRKMLVRILTSRGYLCEQAEDGQQAIDVYRVSVESGHTFFAITMDSEMPVMNGPTATGHLRALGCTAPIIGVTGNLLPDEIQQFKAQGATAVICKPVNVDRFEELVLEHHRVRK